MDINLQKCFFCHGTGETRCYVCSDIGYEGIYQNSPEVRFETKKKDCLICNGTGKVKCVSCKGTGFVNFPRYTHPSIDLSNLNINESPYRRINIGSSRSPINLEPIIPPRIMLNPLETKKYVKPDSTNDRTRYYLARKILVLILVFLAGFAFAVYLISTGMF